MRLSGRVAIITGGASGIGRATAELFAAEGARLAISDIDASAGRALAEELERSGREVIFLSGDVTRDDDVVNLVSAAANRFGRIDIAFANAGINPIVSTSTDLSIPQWQQIMDVNALGVFLCVKHAIPHLVAAGGGSIITMGSVSGLIGWGSTAAYAASKGAVIAMTRYWALELASNHIRVNCVCPGSILTPMVEAQLGGFESRDARLASIASIHPIGRVGTAVDVARAVLYLASDESSFVTGASLVIDGGLTIA